MRISLHNVAINTNYCYQSKLNHQADIRTRDIPYYSATGFSTQAAELIMVYKLRDFFFTFMLPRIVIDFF